MITDLDKLGALLDARRRTLFRLETLEVYEVASDGSDYRRYLYGEPEPERERKQPWIDELRAERDSGYYRHRVHVLRTPLCPYLRYECEWDYAYNVQPGEDIRILDLADTPAPPDLVDHDFWLVDEDLVVLMHYDDAGHFPRRRGATRNGDATLCCRPRCRLGSRHRVRAVVGGSTAVPSLHRIGGVSPRGAV